MDTSDNFVINSREVDQAAWFAVGECHEHIAGGSLAKRFLCAYLQEQQAEA